MSSLAGLITQAAQAERSGAGAESLVTDTPNNQPEEAAYAMVGDDTETSVDTSDQDVRSGEAAESGESAEAKKGEPQQSDSMKEEIEVTDQNGRRKITIDYADKEKTKKAYQLAAGMRKFQAERDQALKKLEPTEKELTAYKQRFELLETTWREKGFDGLVQLLTDGKQNEESWYKARKEREDRRAMASPAELERMDLEEAQHKKDAEIAALAKKMADLEQNVKTEREQAETAKLEATVHPAFDKYRFEGKLGSEADELLLDEMMWSRATKQFDEYKAQGVALTPELIEREFKRQNVALSKLIKQQAEDKASKVIERKKADATEHAQRRVKQGMSSSKEEKEARDMLANGDTMGFFRNIGKYGKYFKN